MKRVESKDEKIFFKTTQQILDLVGKENFSQVSSCFSRLRLKIIDKELVDENQLDLLELVKGHVYVGNELQIIIEGGNAAKIAQIIRLEIGHNDSDNFELKTPKNTKNKNSFGDRFLAAVNGVVIPIVPLLFLSGFIMGIDQILLASNLIKVPTEGQLVGDLDMWSALMYILSNSGLTLLSIFFCYSTVKYMNGDGIIGIFLGLLIASRYFIEPVTNGMMGSHRWDLFKIGELQISIKAYNNNIIPAVGVGMIYVYLDRWVKKWMPGAVDIIFRPLLVVTVVFFASFFVILPILEIVEFGISWLVNQFFKIPFGIGGAILGFLWFPLVVLGVSWSVSITLDFPYLISNGQIPLKAYLVYNALSLATIGTFLALMVRESDSKIRSGYLAAMIPLFFNISEPGVYGYLIRKPKLFWLTNLSGAFVGFFITLFGVTQANLLGGGILAPLGNIGHWRNIALYFAISLAGLIMNFIMGMFLYNEKENETKLVKKSFDRIIVFVQWNNKNQNKKFDNKTKKSRSKLKKELSPLYDKLFLLKYPNKDYYNIAKKLNRLTDSLDVTSKKYEQKRNKILTKISKTKKSKTKIKYQTKLTKYEEKMQLKLKTLSEQIAEYEKILNFKTIQLKELNIAFFNYCENEIKKFLQENLVTIREQDLLDNVWNAVNDNLIKVEELQKKQIKFDKKDFYQTDNKLTLKFLPKVSFS